MYTPSKLDLGKYCIFEILIHSVLEDAVFFWEIKGNVLLSLVLVHQKCLLFFGYKNSFKYSIYNAFPFYFHVKLYFIVLFAWLRHFKSEMSSKL